ncbi:hypothetical protein EC973_002096 [Apophysomyces ossiformis]|uniref:Uncharacterized protein n=1 Tax=Apophysomyces ossiformis TaxID=679940 RepID=A0A8H7BH43_9FUNG|nr:hypothetical protein EC973_002096 [Apophysomyces ossiformis]
MPRVVFLIDTHFQPFSGTNDEQTDAVQRTEKLIMEILLHFFYCVSMNVTWGYRFFCSDETTFFCDNREFHEVSRESVMEFCKEFRQQLGSERMRHLESYDTFVDYHMQNPQLESLEMTLSQTLDNFAWDGSERLSKDNRRPIENYVYAVTACPHPPDTLIQDHKFRVWTKPTSIQQQLREKYLERHISINCIDVSDPVQSNGADKEGFEAFFAYFGGQVVSQRFLLADRYQIPFSSIFSRYCPTFLPKNITLPLQSDSDTPSPADHDLPIWFGTLSGGPDVHAPTFTCPVSVHLFLSTSSIARSKELFQNVTNIHSIVVLHYTSVSPTWFAALPDKLAKEGTFLLRAADKERTTFTSFLRFLKSRHLVLLCELTSTGTITDRPPYQALIDVATPETASFKLLQRIVDTTQLRRSKRVDKPCVNTPATGEVADFLRFPLLQIPDEELIKHDWHKDFNCATSRTIEMEPPQHILHALATRRSRKRTKEVQSVEIRKEDTSNGEKRNISNVSKRALAKDISTPRALSKTIPAKKQKTLGELMNEEKATKFTRSTLEDLPFMKRIVDFKNAPKPQKEKGYIQAKMDLTKEVCGRVMVKPAGPFFKSANDNNTAKRRKLLSPVTMESFLEMVTKEASQHNGKKTESASLAASALPPTNTLLPGPSQPVSATTTSALSPHGYSTPKLASPSPVFPAPISPPRPTPARLAHLAAGKRDLLPFFEEAISDTKPLPELIPHRFDRIFDEDDSDFKPLVLRIPTDVELYENRHYFE